MNPIHVAPSLFLYSLTALALACGGKTSSPSGESAGPSQETRTETRPQETRLQGAAMSSPAAASAQGAMTMPKAGGKPAVLVELFTSQGCSSCPPADALLSKLDALSEHEVIALAFHVDYWNYIGWNDPFSSSEATSRQRIYAKRLAKGRSYTPQLVVQGQAHEVGSRKKAVLALIDKAANADKNSSEERLDLAMHVKAIDKNHVAVSFADLPELGDTALFVALAENGIETRVKRGENAGKTLRNDHIVRQWIAVEGGAVELELPGNWRQRSFELVAVAQARDDLAIHGLSRLLLDDSL